MSLAKQSQTVVAPGDFCQYYCVSRGVNKFIATNSADKARGSLH